jgi:6-phosphogluconolactonase
MTGIIKRFENTDAIAEELASVLLQLAFISNSEKGIHIALSGGNTPKQIFNYLTKHYGERLANPNFHFWWGDERCVAPTSDESNYKWANLLWLQPIGILPIRIHRVIGENKPTDEAIRYSNEITKLVTFKDYTPRFDLILLGLGDDGHTASIFPHQMELLHTEKTCAVATHPISEQKRITFTGKLLNQAAQVVFISTGKGKAKMIQNVALNAMPEYPASHINPTYGTLEWWIDKEAAELL